MHVNIKALKRRYFQYRVQPWNAQKTRNVNYNGPSVERKNIGIGHERTAPGEELLT